MKKFLLTVATLCWGAVASAAAIPVSGVVEGFYGTPWTHEQRMDMVQFIGERGMNAYIYAPKDDPYHRSEWRKPYPLKPRLELKELQEIATKYGVTLVFAVSPGLDISFDGEKGEQDAKIMMDKLQMMYNMGMRQFALFFDDIEKKNAKGQAKFVNRINQELINKYPDCKPLMVVPTEYFLLDMEKNGKVQPYTKNLAKRMNSDVILLYTGLEVCPDGLSEDEIAKGHELYVKQKMGIWWNYPVNDYMKDAHSWGLGPIDKMPKKTDIECFFVNPMDKPELSKIAIATAAEFVASPAEYDEDAAWHRAIDSLYSKYDRKDVDVSGAMLRFAAANQRLENSWAHIGRQNEGEVSEDDIKILLENLPEHIAKEINP